MGNCIVTKLSEVVNNDSLKKVGQIDLVANGIANGSNGYIRIIDGDGGHIVSNGTIYSDSARSQSLGSETDITTAEFYVTFSNNTTKISITSKYNITRYEIGSAIKIADVGDLAYSPNNVVVGYWNGYGLPTFGGGSIDDLAVRQSKSVIMKRLGTYSALALEGVSGNIVNLDKFGFDNNNRNYSDLSLRGSSIKGDISAFANFNTDWKTSLNLIITNDANVGKIYGNIEAFSDYVNISSFQLNNISITGNIATALGRMTKLTLIEISGHTGAEDLKNLFDTLYSNGKVSGSITVRAGSNKTLNGGTWTNGSTVTFTANGWSVG